MHFKTIGRDEILPMIEQAKKPEEQKKLLCDLLDCSQKELTALIKELKAERAEKQSPEPHITKKVAENDELTEVAAYAKKLEGEIEHLQDRASEAEKALQVSKELIIRQSERHDRLAEEKSAVLDTLAKALALIASLQRLANIGGAKG